ncbi:MAG TPA: ABC transporter permease [Streptosporangiaceae bacterium]|jgi:peptide/nickel transport system permease protein|nr:ABC transporter permease [Streptosporangiaceae bacterium]
MTTALPINAELPALAAPPPSQLGRWRRLPIKAKAGAVMLGLFVLCAIIGPMVAPYDPSYQNPNPALSLAAPSAQHLLGTTQSGQDVLSQLLTGIRLTLELGILVGIIATILSVLVGVTAAYLGGVWDELLSLVSNVFLVIPALPLLIILLGYLPRTGQTATILVLAFLGWPWGARVIRAQTLAIRGRDFVAASRETGESGWRIISFEIVPNEVSLIAANFVNTVLYAIGTSVALAFIGLTNLNSWSLGTMLYWAQSQDALQLGAWWWFIPPGLAVALMGTSLVLLNTGIDELGNPRLRDANQRAKVNGRRLYSTAPTPVLHAPPQRRPSPVAAFVRSFSRSAYLADRTRQASAAQLSEGKR